MYPFQNEFFLLKLLLDINYYNLFNNNLFLILSHFKKMPIEVVYSEMYCYLCGFTRTGSVDFAKYCPRQPTCDNDHGICDIPYEQRPQYCIKKRLEHIKKYENNSEYCNKIIEKYKKDYEWHLKLLNDRHNKELENVTTLETMCQIRDKYTKMKTLLHEFYNPQNWKTINRIVYNDSKMNDTFMEFLNVSKELFSKKFYLDGRVETITLDNKYTIIVSDFI